MKKEGLFFLFSFSVAALFFVVVFFPVAGSIKVITGEAITGDATQGGINVTVGVTALVQITIDSPQNTTYEFNSGDIYFVDLNVSSDIAPGAWWFTLVDITGGTTINNSVIFTPNITIYPNEGSHEVTVYANNSAGAVSSASVTFSIHTNNTAPSIEGLDSEILVCEGTFLSYRFNVTDVNADYVTVDISPKNPFYVHPTSFSGVTLKEIQLYSGWVLTKSQTVLHLTSPHRSD
ncbi:MAG: hypothetical protein KJ600_03700 [Nanoarchaeota archaeon]|nr:hypothetical protein [Nanoarchaeota archaeon]